MALLEHLEKLRHFHKICSYPSLQAASRALGISQAGLSKSLQALESALNTKLFVRTPTGLIITQSGKLLFESSEAIFNETLKAEAAINLRGSVRSPKNVRFGMYDSIAVYFYASLSRYVGSVYPTVNLEIEVERSAKLESGLQAAQLDLIIGVNAAKSHDKQHSYFHLWDDSYGFYVNAQLSESDDKTPLIYHPDAKCAEGKTCSQYLSSIIVKRPAVRAYNFETIKALTLSSLGCGVLPTQVARPYVQSGQLKSIRLLNQKQTFGPHSIDMVVHKSFAQVHSAFVDDLLRISSSWSKK